MNLRAEYGDAEMPEDADKLVLLVRRIWALAMLLISGLGFAFGVLCVVSGDANLLGWLGAPVFGLGTLFWALVLCLAKEDLLDLPASLFVETQTGLSGMQYAVKPSMAK